MNVRNPKTLVALAAAGNVTRTAEQLDHAPSSVRVESSARNSAHAA